MKEMLVLDRGLLKGLIRRRRAMGVDQRDEVWDGVYIIMPLADNEHQALTKGLTCAFDRVVGSMEGIQIFAGVNVRDQPEDWKKNFRCPDVAVYCPQNPAQDCGSHWFGGPDFAVEIISPNDRSRKKLDFYAAVNVRELLLVARKPWRLELYRRQGKDWTLVGKSDLAHPEVLTSEVLPLALRLVDGAKRPQIEVTSQDGAQRHLA